MWNLLRFQQKHQPLVLADRRSIRNLIFVVEDFVVGMAAGIVGMIGLDPLFMVSTIEWIVKNGLVQCIWCTRTANRYAKAVNLSKRSTCS